jgi:hypothetical protein
MLHYRTDLTEKQWQSSGNGFPDKSKDHNQYVADASSTPFFLRYAPDVTGGTSR